MSNVSLELDELRTRSPGELQQECGGVTSQARTRLSVQFPVFRENTGNFCKYSSFVLLGYPDKPLHCRELRLRLAKIPVKLTGNLKRGIREFFCENREFHGAIRDAGNVGPMVPETRGFKNIGPVGYCRLLWLFSRLSSIGESCGTTVISPSSPPCALVQASI